MEKPATPVVGSALQVGGFQLDWMVVALVVCLAIISYSVWKAQKDPENNFNLLDLVLEEGKISKAATVMLGAFAVTSWVIIQLALNGKLTEGFFGAYMLAWVSPTVTRIIKGPQVIQPGATP